MRIAVISFHSCPLARLGGKETGGMNVYVRELARELGRNGIPVDIFTRSHGHDMPQVVRLGEQVRLIHLDAGPKSAVEKNGLYRHLPQFIGNVLRFADSQDIEYDLVHSHYWLSGLAGAWLQAHWKIPHVTMFHTLGEIKVRARRGETEPQHRIDAERRVVAAAQRIVASSQHERNQLVRLYGAQDHQIEVMPCGINLRLFRQRDKALARKELELTDPKIVLFVGRLEPIKGLDLLLHSLSRLEDKQGVRLLIIGGESQKNGEQARLENLASQLNIDDQVRFLGPVEHSRLPLYYSAADICVVPSYYESFGLVALESLACGTPVIASRVGGLVNVVRDGENGFLIPWRCPEPYTDAIELLLGNAQVRESFSRAGQQWARRFQWPTVASRIINVYRSLLTPQLALTAP